MNIIIAGDGEVGFYPPPPAPAPARILSCGK